MSLIDRFDASLASSVAQSNFLPIFLPELLTQLCVAALPIDGASLSLLSDELRMPLAASDEQARAAEMVQFTLGEGPCLETYRTKQVASLTRSDLVAHWPMYLDAIVEATDFRSVMSVPIDFGDHLVGVLDLFLISPDSVPADSVADALAITARVGAALQRSPGSETDDPSGPTWLRSPGMQRRATTWIAIGLIARAADLDAFDALDLIRAHAWRLGQSVDDISYELASHTLLAEHLIDELNPKTATPPGE